MTEKEKVLIDSIKNLEETSRFRDLIASMIELLKAKKINLNDDLTPYNEFFDLKDELSNLANLINITFKNELEFWKC